MNMFPFFIECSKYYTNEPYKQKFLQKLALGHGIHIIKRKDKHILVTPNGEFVIPYTYSDKARNDLAGKLWQVNEFTRLGDRIEETRQTWHTTRKKDKMYLLYKYISSLPDLTFSQKVINSNILILAMLLKIIKPVDIDYKDSKIQGVNDYLLEKETYTQMNFVYDYSIPQRTRSQEITTAYTVDDDEDEV
jgi:SepF-like predicted cell division protein (DUF552 family)